jgi:hypothetical protein
MMTLMMMQQSRYSPLSSESSNLHWEEPADVSQLPDFEPIIFGEGSTEKLAEEAIQEFTSEFIEQPEVKDNTPS